MLRRKERNGIIENAIKTTKARKRIKDKNRTRATNRSSNAYDIY